MRASELLLIVRAQNQASAALRRVAADMRGLSEMQRVQKGMAASAGDMNKMNEAMRRLRWDKLAAGGRIMQHTARVMEYGGLVLGGSLAVMAKQAADFNTEVTLAATQTRKAGQSFIVTGQNSQKLQKDIRDLMTQFPQQADDFAKAAYDIYSSTDVSFGGGRKLLKLFAQAATAGMTDVQTATDAGITVMNNFGQDITKMPKRLQTMFAAVRFGRMTFDQFAKSMSTIAPAARASNQTFNEMAGTFAFLTRHLDVAKARVGFARVLEALTQPKMLLGLKKAGIQIQDANHHLIPLDQIIGKIVTKFPKLRGGGTDAMNFFKNIGGLQSTMQARRAFTFLVQFYDKAGKDGASYRSMLRQVNGDQNEFTQSLRAMEKTTGVRWGVFVNQIKALALEFGSDLVPAILRLSGPIKQLVGWWRGLDASTRAFVARLATYTAVFMLVGGAVTYLGGTFVRLFATLGKYRLLGAGIVAGFIAFNAAVALLSGNLHGLSDLLDTIANFTFSSFQNFAISMGVAAAGAIKLTSALRGMAAAEGAIGAGSILGSLLGRGRAARTGFQVGREVGGLKSGLALAVGEAGLLSGSLLVSGGILAAGVGALALWKLHMREAAKEAAYFKRNVAMAAAPRQQIDVFQQMGLGVENVERAKIAMRDAARAVADTRKQLVGAKGTQRLALLDQLKSQTMDLINAQDAYSVSLAKSNKQFEAYHQSFVKLGSAGRQLNTLKNQLGDLLRTQQRAPMTPGIQQAIDSTRKSIRGMVAEIAPMAQNLNAAFSGVVKHIARIEGIKIPKGALQDLANVAARSTRALSIPTIKALIRAEVDPRSARKLPADLRRLFSQVKAQRIKVEVDQASQRKAAAEYNRAQQKVPKALRLPFRIPDATPAAKKAYSATAKVFSKVIKQHIQVVPPGNLASIGADIVSGIQAGVDAAGPISVQKVVHESIKKQIESGSPSRWAIREVGKPIGQGIALGVLATRLEVEKAATATITFFESAAIQKAQEAKKKISDALLIKDVALQAKTLTQFNNALAKLFRRKVPRELIDQLAALGPEQTKQIAQIANMNEKQLRNYVRQWTRANNQVKRSFRANTADIKAAQKELHDNLKSSLRDMFESLRDTTSQQFGDLFAGIDPATYGEGLKQAQADYASQVADFQGQIADLNQQMVDAQKEAAQRLTDAIQQRKDELQQAFGQLFSGDWLSGVEVQTKLDWGAKLGFDDLQKDLQSQVDKFKRWRADLTSLAGKVPPELAKQLEALGPEAVDKLDILNNATSDQIAQYVATWQDGQNQMQAVANQTTVDTSDITARMADISKQMADVIGKIGALQYPHQLTGQDLINDLQNQMDQWDLYQGLLQGLIDKGLPPQLIEQLSQLGPQAIPMLQALTNMSKPELDKYAAMWQEKEDTITTDTLKHLNKQLDLWFDYGAGIAQNIVKGIKSQGAYLTDYFTALIKSLLERTQLPPIPPIRPTGAEGPTHLTLGDFPLANDIWLRNATSDTSGVSKMVVVNQTVNAVQGESLDATLNKANFRLQGQLST